MVLKSQDLLSDATVIRTPNQNGSCSSNGASVLPLKWKPRSVSAVRDFPRGCGSIMQPVNTGIAETQVESLPHDISKSTEDGKMELIVECQKEKGDNLVMLKDEISSSVTGVIEVDDNGGSVNAIKESTRKLKFPQRRVSAVREFPPYCGLNATEPTKEERIRINGKRRFGIEDKGSVRNEKLIDSVVVGSEESNGNVKDDSLHKTQIKESNESLMENQDPMGDKSDKQSMEKMIVVDEESNINVQKGKALKLKDDLDNESQIASQIIKKVCQDLVVYTCDNDLKKRSVIDLSDEDSEENLEDESFHNSKPQVVMPIRSLAPIQENIKKVKGESKRVSHKKHLKDDTNSPVFIRGDRSVVIGLMAPSVVPFITPKKSKSEKVKVVEESSAFTTSITPNKSESEKVKVVEEASTHTTSITPNKSKSEKVKVDEELSTHTTSIKPKKSKSKKVKVVEESDTFTTSITPEKLESEKVKVVEESSAHTTSVTPKKSKSVKVKVLEDSSTHTTSITPMKSESEKVKVVEESSAHTTSITPNKSKSKKVKVEESSAHTSTTPIKSKSKKVKVSKESTTYTGTLDIVVRTEEPVAQETEEQGDEFPNSHEVEVEVAVPPFGPRSSNSARNRIRETLRRFQVLCRKLLQGEEAKISEDDESKHVLTGKRVDLTAKSILEKQGKIPDRGKKTYGSIPGIEVGDEFQYRVELALVGLHWLLQGGIDYIRHGNRKTPVAVSVVASGGYDNELNKPECLIYSGSGGIGKDKQILDQKLERGNIALKNNINLKIPVRVIRGYKGKSTEPSSKSLTTTYIYDGLYTVEKYWQEKGPLGNLVFKFELKRIPGQPELAIREVKSKKFKTREGLCVDDITNGKEKIRISAVNTINDENPPSFNYITKIMYPDWYRPVPPTGCDCVGRCSDKRCKCAAKNGGEIPYNHNGAIVEAKPLVYECGPACKCPPSCYNRVTQHGMKIQLEIFKTETRGWGVRSLNSISSGSFICEYVGELLEDTEAEKRTGNDEYLFDIGQNYSDMGTGTGVGMDTGTDGFTIDAANYGNVGRFINHSCSPNLYAQNVLYDQEDKRMPHIMLFAAENIPPLQELTYHYNYAVDTVHDSDGNIKVKKCFCGSTECTGRLY